MKNVMLTFVLVTGILSAGSSDAALPITDGAEPVAVNHVEVELNGSYACDTAKRGGVTAKSGSADGDVTVTAGVVPGVDLSVTLPYTFSAREKENGLLANKAEGLNDATLDVKVRFVDHDGLKVAIKPWLILPTGRRDRCRVPLRPLHLLRCRRGRGCRRMQADPRPRGRDQRGEGEQYPAGLRSHRRDV